MVGILVTILVSNGEFHQWKLTKIVILLSRSRTQKRTIIEHGDRLFWFDVIRLVSEVTGPEKTSSKGEPSGS